MVLDQAFQPLTRVWRWSMVTQPKVTMTMRDLDRLKCIQGVIDRELTVYQAYA